MRKPAKALIIFFIFWTQILCYPATPLRAAEAGDNIILLIDNSGSMQKSDPMGLAPVAASMLVDSLGPSDNLNIISFGSEVISPNRLKDKPSPEALKSSLSMFNYNDSHTNLKDGIKEAMAQLGEVEGKKRIIILSDGREDPKGGATTAHFEELNALIESAQKAKINTFTIGLSDKADREMLNSISYKTGGAFFSCTNTADLFDIFGKIMGSSSGFYTLDKFTTGGGTEKTINFSSYIEEIVIKTASIENRAPNVEVTRDGEAVSAEKYHDKYKIYRIKNDRNTSIKITAGDSYQNLVIVQMKSKASIGVDTADDSFQIPRGIPLEIEASLDVGSEVQVVNMFKIEDGKRDILSKENGRFRSTFQRDGKGEYPIVLAAYDGSNNIIAVRTIDISVIDYPPFYYTEVPPGEMLTGKPLEVSLKQLRGEALNSISAVIFADYEDSQESFQLQMVDGVLRAEVILKKSGDIRLTTCISGVYNNLPFSYYLPSRKVTVKEKPRLGLEVIGGKGILKVNEPYNLRLNIKDSLTHVDEKIEVFTVGGKWLGEFTVRPGQTGEVEMTITPTEEGRLTLYFKGQKDLSLTEELKTSLRVLSPFGYFVSKNIALIISAAGIFLLCLLTVFTGLYVYKNKIMSYNVSRQILYKTTGSFKTLSFELGTQERYVYLKADQNRLFDAREDFGSFGYFELKLPERNKIMLGLIYLIKKEQLFQIEYSGTIEQKAWEDFDPVSLPITYKTGTVIKFKYKNLNYEIQFQ